MRSTQRSRVCANLIQHFNFEGRPQTLTPFIFGMGIASAFHVSEEAGAFAGVAMTALASSILFPPLLWVFTR